MTLPTRVHELRGNPSHSRVAKALIGVEAKPELITELPEPPDFLSESAIAEWWRAGAELLRVGLLTQCDLAVFAAYCQSYGRWSDCERMIRDAAKDSPSKGMTTRSTANQSVHTINPLVRIAEKAAEHMASYAAQLGLTPIGRRRIAVAGTAGARPSNKFSGLIGNG